MKHKWKLFLFIFALLLLVTCTPWETHTYCDCVSSNKDSLIQRVIVHYDVDAYRDLWLCHSDSNIDLYGILVADSSGTSGSYLVGLPIQSEVTHINDTVALFYAMKGGAKGSFSDICSMFVSYKRSNVIEVSDSLCDILWENYFHNASYSPLAMERYRRDKEDLDYIKHITMRDADIKSYDTLRFIIPYDDLLPLAIRIANKTHYPAACCDVYLCTVSMQRLTQREFDFAYSYLCEAADSLFYPAVMLKACLYLTGAYFPPDTILGKELLEQCQVHSTIPFWQQYYKPLVYRHLLPKNNEQ